MTVKKVYVQLGEGGMPVAPCGYAMWEGARFLGLKPEGLNEDHIGSGLLGLDETTLVHGWVRTVHRALKELGVPIPPPIDYPPELAGYLGRNIGRSTLDEVHRKFAADNQPVFIKPVQHKLFTGHTLERFSDLAETTNIDMASEIWVSDVEKFVSEYRCFVHEGGLVGMYRYTGDAWKLPEKRVVIDMVRAYSPTAPVSYSIDVGVTPADRTLLVECNDAYSLGNYGLNSLIYVEMVISRWEEMCRTK